MCFIEFVYLYWKLPSSHAILRMLAWSYLIIFSYNVIEVNLDQIPDEANGIKQKYPKSDMRMVKKVEKSQKLSTLEIGLRIANLGYLDMLETRGHDTEKCDLDNGKEF